MIFNPSTIPLSLYVHIPWCVKKCPYCDFNSHTQKKPLPETEYIQALLQDLHSTLENMTPEMRPDEHRPIQSIFIGGGTPSLFSPAAIESLLVAISKQVVLKPDLEITLEANPGALEYAQFQGFKQAGINRLSIGVQSTLNHHLKSLGRIHTNEEVFSAIQTAQATGFNLNIDLMHGLPNQTLEEALHDLNTIMGYHPQHISWYQLTLEPHTYFAKHPPKLPKEPLLLKILSAGTASLEKAGYQHYEISAFCREGFQSQHNLNYWRYGDYIGIGAGAHSKLTSETHILRQWKTKSPAGYLNPDIPFLEGSEIISPHTALLEFMMNQLRVTEPFLFQSCLQRTGMSAEKLHAALQKPRAEHWITQTQDQLQPTPLGQRYLDEWLLSFV